MTALRDALQRTLGDAYTIDRELTGGGMSTVFVARDRALGRDVVVKVLPYELAATLSVERFKREIMLSASLQHPHIVPVLSAGETQGENLPYFIMPFVDGKSLRARLEMGPLSMRETVSIMKDVARALAYAHGRGVIHRDIKPDNILLTAGSATVTDFGVAKAVAAAKGNQRGLEGKPKTATTHALTSAGTSIGTPAYMAPEQAAGDPNTDHRADLYALGIVGYEMLVGSPPFQAATPQQLLAAQLTQPPPPISARRTGVPKALDALLMRLLAKDPGERPKNASDVARALEDPEMVSGTFDAAPSHGATDSGRNRVIWAFAGAGILASLALGGAYFENRHEPAPTAGAVAAAKSVAVLPMVSIGNDSNEKYFAEGMTANLANALTRLPGLRVASLTATQAAVEKGASPSDLSHTLNVAMLVEGTVQREGGRLRVTARLISIKNDSTLWSGMFDRDGKDVFAVQDELSRSIIDAVFPELSTSRGA